MQKRGSYGHANEVSCRARRYQSSEVESKEAFERKKGLQSGKKVSCKFCGYEHAPVKKKFPAWGKTCNRCKERNHSAKKCEKTFVYGRCENPECRNITEYHGISRNMAEYHGICRYHHGIWGNITEYHDIFREYTGTSQYSLMAARGWQPCDCL